MSTVENNKIIAEFIGAGVDGRLEYHLSWDWLMPVVEEIHRTKEASIEIHSNSTKVSYGGRTKIFAGGFEDSLDNTYRAVLEFINNN